MSGVGMRASPIAITVTVAALITGCCLRPACAQVAPDLPASEPSNALDLDGRVVREIRIAQGLRPSTIDIVRRHLASREGLPFHPATLLEDRRRLDALRLFSAIEIKPVAAGAEVVLEVDVKETLRLLPFVALSVTDENGLSAGPAFRGINLLGRGTLSSGSAQFGGMTMVGARVARPTVTPGAWAFDVGAGYRSRRNELFDFNDEISTAIAANAGWNWTDRVQVGGQAEFVWFDTGSSDVSLSPDGTDHLPAVGLSATYNSLDSLSNPRVGWFGVVDIGRQFGDADSWSLTVDGRRFQPLTARTTVSLVAFAAFQSGVVGRDLPEVHAVRYRRGELRAGLGVGIARRQEPGNRDSRVPCTPSCPCVRLPCSGATSMVAFRPRRSATSAWRGPTRSHPRTRSTAMASVCGCWFPSSTSSGWIWPLENRGRCPLRDRHPPQGGQAARSRAVTRSHFSLTLGTGKVAVTTRFCPSVFTRAPISQK